MPSGFSPMKLYEYMSCGKPVVATDVEGVRFLKTCQAGFLVDPQDPEQVASNIIRLLVDDELRRQMGENAKLYVVEQGGWRHVAEQVSIICKRATERHSA
jgi:glycosyltransferase involved in cell wall biosynthesis